MTDQMAIGVRAGFWATLLLTFGVCHAKPPPRPTDPAADRWVQDVERAYADTRTYQSTGTASIIQSGNGPDGEAQRATMRTQVALDRPNRRLFVRVDVDTRARIIAADVPLMLLVCDGQKLRLRLGMFNGHYLETDIPESFNFDSISGIIGGMMSPAVMLEMRLLLEDQALAGWATKALSPPKLEKKVDSPHQDTPAPVSLVFTQAAHQCTLGIDPERHLIHRIHLIDRQEDSTTTTQYTISIDKHNQPLDDALFTFDTAGSKAARSLKELFQSGASARSAGAQAAHPALGQDAPPFELKTPDGRPFKLEDVDASVVVLDFWATWCPPCRRGLPQLQRFHDWAQANGKPVAVYAVNLQETPQAVRDYWEQEGFTMPVLMDTRGEVALAYQVQGIPQTVMIHQGKVVRVHVGLPSDLDTLLQNEVEELLDDKPQP